MAKVLYVKATPKKLEDSYTLKVAHKFLEDYKSLHPEDEITELDLYSENLRPLDEKDLVDLFTNPNSEILKYVNDFITYDKYVFAAPLWNLSVPAILKMYIDYLLVTGKTFKYTESGPVGLLAGQSKKAKFIAARGGFYGAEPYSNYELGEKYMKTILGFIGIEDFSTIAFEKTNMLPVEEVEKNLKDMYVEIEKQAKEF